jgi:hypothetical protein
MKNEMKRRVDAFVFSRRKDDDDDRGSSKWREWQHFGHRIA